MQFVYRNPHSFVHVEAPDDKGMPQRWAVEWSGGGQLANQGVTKDSILVVALICLSLFFVWRHYGVPGSNARAAASTTR